MWIDYETTVHIHTDFVDITVHSTTYVCVVAHIPACTCVNYSWPELMTLDGCVREAA